jgi:hypothetical protein
MEMKFLTLLPDNNAWIDWYEFYFGSAEGLDYPSEFPCYVGFECIGYDDKDEEGDCKGDALFWPHFLYYNDVEAMFEKLG